MSYIGNTPGIGQGQTFFYTLGAGATSASGADANGRTLTYTPGLFMIVSLNGTVLNPTEYTATNGTSITFVGWTAAAGDELFVYAFGAFALADMVRLSLGLNDLPDKDAALLNLGLSANGRSLVKAANYSSMLDLLGFSAFFKTLIDDPDQATLRASLGVNSVDYQEFTTVGANTWTKPSWATANSLIIKMLWGGGASGARGNPSGGGGSFVIGFSRAGFYGATVSVSVGAGGAGDTVAVNSPSVANAGGSSSFGSAFTAPGGGTGGAAGSPPTGALGQLGFPGATGTTAAGANAIWGGASGGYGANAGGTSIFGGNGGAGSTALGVVAGAGTAPGGGGGSNTAFSSPNYGPAGAGARGEVRVWTIG